MDGLFDLEPQPIREGDHVEITMIWGEVWQCKVVGRTRGEWPGLVLHHDGAEAGDTFEVDPARCRPIIG